MTKVKISVINQYQLSQQIALFSRLNLSQYVKYHLSTFQDMFEKNIKNYIKANNDLISELKGTNGVITEFLPDGNLNQNYIKYKTEIEKVQNVEIEFNIEKLPFSLIGDKSSEGNFDLLYKYCFFMDKDSQSWFKGNTQSHSKEVKEVKK